MPTSVRSLRNVLSVAADRVAGNFDAAGIDLFQPVDAAQQRALSGPGPADQREDLATLRQ